MKAVKLVLLLLIIYYVPKFCASKTDGFTLLKIHSNLTYHPEWETAPLNQVQKEQLKAITAQKFTYLSSGGQCYVFGSEDGKYVLKLFKHHLRRVPYLLAHIPLPDKWSNKRDDHVKKREHKLLRDFSSYRLSYDNLKEESGLLYVHLNKTSDLHMQTTLVDKLGIEHRLALDPVEFVIQKRAVLVFPHLKTLIQEQKKEEARYAIDQIVNLIVSRCQKGIYDQDPRIGSNIGFLEDRAILIDIGRLEIDPNRKDPEIYRKDLEQITSKLQMWLNKNGSPELASYLVETIHEI